MKKLSLLLLLILLPAVGFAGSSNHVNIAFISSVGASCDSCTGGLLFSWHVSGANPTAALTVTNGTAPDCGCSVGDTIATLSGGGTIASSPSGPDYSFYCSGGYDAASFDISSRDIIDVDEGTMTFDVYFVTATVGTSLMLCEGQVAEDYIQIDIPSSGELRFRYEGANAGSVYASTSGASFTTSVWYTTVTAKWRQTGSPNTSITINSVTGTNDTELTAMDTLPTTLDWGNLNNGTAGQYYLRNMKVYDSWL